MATTDSKAGVGLSGLGSARSARPEPLYQATFVDSPFFLVSLVRQILDLWRSPKLTVPTQYYRGEAALPIVEMRPWYRDLPSQLKLAFEKPRDPIGIYNRAQVRKRALCAALGGIVLGAGGWFWNGNVGLAFGAAAGFGLGELAGVLVFKKREYPPEIWRDYQQQPVSWINSLLVHALVIAALMVPFIIKGMVVPVRAQSSYKIVEISPYLAEIPAQAKKMGGGGGGGDRSPTPASKGAVPKFAKEQLAPPMAKIPILTPKIPVTPTLLGPPQLKLPEMQASTQWGDPHGVLGPASNGPGFGGGIGSGSGGGIGSGTGGGLGPGEGGGTGGGVYSVGGGVSEPIPIFRPDPPYSEEARKAKLQGTVTLAIIVNVDGAVHDVHVVKPVGMGLDEKAAETVSTWKFKPAKRNGVPVPVRVLVEVTFRLF